MGSRGGLDADIWCPQKNRGRIEFFSGKTAQWLIKGLTDGFCLADFSGVLEPLGGESNSPVEKGLIKGLTAASSRSLYLERTGRAWPCHPHPAHQQMGRERRQFRGFALPSFERRIAPAQAIFSRVLRLTGVKT
eukprot:4612601-Pyramimonas_sp.AAC.1